MTEKEESSQKFEKLRREAEEKLEEAIDSTKEISKEEAPPIKELLHELQVHQVELELQNEELRETRNRLRKVKERYANLYNSAPVSYLTLNEEGDILDANKTAAEKLNAERDKLIGDNLYKYLEEADRDDLFKHLRKAFEKKDRQNRELEFIPDPDGDGKESGQRFHGLLTSKVFKDGEGELVCRTTLSDITARKRAEEKVKESEEKYRTVFETTGTAMLIIEEDTTISLANQKAEELSGYPLEEIEGASWRDMVAQEEELARMEKYHKLRREDPAAAPNQYEFKLVDKKGNEKEVLISIDVIPGTNKSVASLIDISGQKQSKRKFRQPFVELAETTSRVLGVRDPYTEKHELRVGELAREVGERMDLDEDKLLGLYIGGVLHDIGKIAVPETILTKPGELKDVEWEMIKSHPKVGYNQILADTNFPWPVAEMTLHHHERLDGSGYPDSLKGDELTTEVRILGAVDVVEAMSTRRPYRAARSRERTLEVIRDGKGNKFDPEVVEVLVEMVEEGKVEFG